MKKKNAIIIILLGIIITINILNSYSLPYLIIEGGGTFKTNDKVLMDTKYKDNIKGSFNMAYVSVSKANLVNYLIAKAKKDWDIIPLSLNTSDFDLYEDNIRSNIDLIQSENQAIEAAYRKAGITLKKKNSQHLVYLNQTKPKNELMAGDIILKVNGIDPKDSDKIKESIKNLNKGDKIPIEYIKHNQKKKINVLVKETLFKEKVIGLSISEVYNYEMKPSLRFDFNKSENGASGGLALALTIYNNLVEKDITNGKKIVVTGALGEENKILPVDGIKQKLSAAIKEKADIFIVPELMNYKEAKNICKKKKCPKLIAANNFDQVVEELEKL